MATVVFDADDTLWEGLILHGEPVSLKPGVFDTIKELHKRGHRLICASRNDPQNLERVLQEQDLWRYFHIILADWGPKSEMFAQFMSPDPTLFIDDDPFNHGEVRRRFPDVEMLLPPPDFLDLLEHPLLSKAVTEEDRKRVQLLKEQRVRTDAEKVYSGTYQEFLRYSQIRLTIYENISVIPDRQRALDLLNRTTEQRTMQQRYDGLPLFAWLFGASLVDRYGEYGLIGIGVVREHRNSWLEPVVLDDLAVSCRTMGRGIGSTLVAWLCQQVKEASYNGVRGKIRPTDRNTAMQQIFEFLGFHPFEQGEDGTVTWLWRSTDPLPPLPDWIAVEVVE